MFLMPTFIITKCEHMVKHVDFTVSILDSKLFYCVCAGKGGGQDQEPDDNVSDCSFEDYISCDRFVAREGPSVEQS